MQTECIVLTNMYLTQIHHIHIYMIQQLVRREAMNLKVQGVVCESILTKETGDEIF